MGTKMCRLIFIACIAFLANLSFAEDKPSVRLPLPKELMSDIPWFALVIKNGEDSYTGVLSKDKLKSIAQQKNSQRVVFAFYATWCIPCKEGIAKMSANAAELEKGGVLVVLINVGETDYAKTDKWVRGYMKDSWLLGFDRFNNIPESFGLSKKGDSQMPLPKTLLLDQDLRPILLIGNEGDDFPLILRD
ncbi:MAG: TlpA family protein disulfide reductase [Fibromonadales bacterium]|nr:TlpA family protein disulfide reductase [Fibromonadales bacterium]